MNKRYKEIIMEDSRSENMLRRLLGVPDRERTRRQRWLLLANGGLLRVRPETAKLKLEA
jgi:hypothetical protein